MSRVREHEGSCPRCGHHMPVREHDISVEEAASRLVRRELDVDDIFERRCSRCGNRVDWEVAIAPREGVDQTLPLGRQRELVEMLRDLLYERHAPAVAIVAAMREYEVEALYVPS